MSKTACWGLNNTFDCAWIIFGYGSRWDMLSGVYEKGFWLSKEALKIFLYYDYPLCSNGWPFTEEELFKNKINHIPNDYFMENNKILYDFIDNEDWNKLDYHSKLKIGWMYINHKDNEKWYEECERYSGGYLRDNNTNKVLSHNEIKKYNHNDWKIINRVYFINDNIHSKNCLFDNVCLNEDIELI